MIKSEKGIRLIYTVALVTVGIYTLWQIEASNWEELSFVVFAILGLQVHNLYY